MIRPLAAALALSTLALCALPVAATAQSSISLGTIEADPTQPVEITADTLSADRDSGQATFSGNVKVGQGDLRLAAGQVVVTYDAATGQVARMDASGGVTFVTATEAAEAQSAVYDLTTGLLTLNGDVLLTQGPNALAAQSMVVNLTTGTAELSGGVRTVFGAAESGN